MNWFNLVLALAITSSLNVHASGGRDLVPNWKIATTGSSQGNSGRSEDPSESAEIGGKSQVRGDFNIARLTSFEIKNQGGAIRISESNDSVIRVLAKNNGKGKANLNYVNRGDRVVLSVDYPNGVGGSSINVSGGSVIITGNSQVIINGVVHGSSGGNGAQVDLEIQIPKLLLYDLHAEAAQGDVELRGYFDNGQSTPRRVIFLKTSQGSIECNRVCALNSITVRSSQGDITLERVIGKLEAKTSQGNIEISKSIGDSELTSSQGNVRAETNIGNIEAKSSQGNIRVSGQAYGGVIARTSMGDVRLNNPKALYEKAKTSMGSARTTQGVSDMVVNKGPTVKDSHCADDLIKAVEQL